MLNFNKVLTKESSRVFELPCSKGDLPVTKEGLHHLTGCKFQQEHFDGKFHLKVGDFYVGPAKGCGSTLEKMHKGQVYGVVSFLGNTTDGLLKPWIKDNARVCNFAEGAVAAPLMIQQVGNAQIFGTFIAIIFCLTALYWATSCFLFAEQNLDRGNAWGRCISIAFLALVMSCFQGALSFYYGDTGVFVGALVISFFVIAGLDKNGFNCFKSRRNDEDPTEDEEQPLMANSDSQAPPAYASPAVEEPAPVAQPTNQPAPPVAQARSDPSPDVAAAPAEDEYDAEPRQAGSGSQLALAIFIGIMAGLAGVVLIILLQVLLTARPPDPPSLAMAFDLISQRIGLS